MVEKKANFVPVSALDKRPPTKRDLLRGLVRQAPFVAKNFSFTSGMVAAARIAEQGCGAVCGYVLR